MNDSVTAEVSTLPRNARRRSRRAGRERRVALLLLAPAFACVLGLIPYPMYLIVTMSLRNGLGINFMHPEGAVWGVANYRAVLSDPATWHSILISAIYV